MRRVVVVLLLAACTAAAVETAYQTAFRRALLRLLDRERALRPTGEIQVNFSRFGKDVPRPHVSGFQDAYEGVRDRLLGESRLRPLQGDPKPVVAYFFADFATVEEDFDRAAGWRGYLWSPRTWSFHSWPD